MLKHEGIRRYLLVFYHMLQTMKFASNYMLHHNLLPLLVVYFVYYIILYCTVLYRIVLDCIVLYCITLRYVTLQYITLYYIIVVSIMNGKWSVAIGVLVR